MAVGGIDAGSPEPLGVTPAGSGVNVAVFSANATVIQFCLFDPAGSSEIRRVTLPERTGEIFHGFVSDVPAGSRYGLRVHGPYAPAEGHRFNPAKLLLDPYAGAIDRPFRLHATMFSDPGGAGFNDNDSAPFMPKGIVGSNAPRGARPFLVPWNRTVLYELHVRGFTMRNDAIPEALRGTFAGLAEPAAIEHLVKLGVTAVEIMPAAAWLEERHLARLGLTNYWGYNPVAFMAPDPRLAPGGWHEVRAAVDALAAAGIETILDIVLNHSGEGDALGPTVSLRGLDNASYYRLLPGNLAGYVDDAGCGNVLALDRPPVVRLAMDCLRAWAEQGGVHGFRFDLATTLGRRADGFDPAAPLLSAIAQDPVLRQLKLIAEPWDVGSGGYRLGQFAPGWGEWNDRFRDDVRRFWRGDGAGIGPLATRLAGSSDILSAKAGPSRGINFVVAHDGFTLCDLVAYQVKHNQANGENNRDGTDANQSWNNGVEGPTAVPAILAARGRDQRALIATLLLARGTPMLAMGMELGKSQGGNNNAYAQDNETAWIDWAGADAALLAWTRRMTEIRRDYPLLAGDRFLTGKPLEGAVLPDVAWLGADGEALADQDWQKGDAPALVMVLTDADDRVAVAMNRGAVDIHSNLPEAREGTAWRCLADSANPEAAPAEVGAEFVLPARSVTVLAERAGAGIRGQRRGGTPALDRLAEAAGIAARWWDVASEPHDVGIDTKRAILAAMRLPAKTEREAAETLARFAEEHDHRPLPYALSGWAGTPLVLEIPLSPGLERQAIEFNLAMEDGDSQSFRVLASEGELSQRTASDGRAYLSWQVELLAMPLGRHVLVRGDAPGFPCHVTVAPRRCFLPDAFAGGRRLWGLSAQLYSLRRAGDAGIGDFTDLAELAAAVGPLGGAAVMINPLHALFAEDIERASPYQPSDRRFLDPIYLDLPGIGTVPSGDMVDYSAVWDAKRRFLERQFGETDQSAASEAGGDFARFVAEAGDALDRFAVFQVIAETYPRRPWMTWPGGLADADSAEVAAFGAANSDRVSYHKYLQYLCDCEFAAAARRARDAGLPIGLVRDLAIGGAPDGAEIWAQRDLYAGGVSIGAPPDTLAPDGQVWGLPPSDPHAMCRTGFAGFARVLKANMRHAGGLRIDHVMGLTRLFWVPEGAAGADGAYVRYPLEDLIAQVSLESERAQCLVVGEDLGTVPDGLRPRLADAGMLGYHVVLLEREGVGFRKPDAYPASTLACVTTHDLPTFAGWWEGAAIEERKAIGLITAEAAEAAIAQRALEKQALLDMLVAENLLADGQNDLILVAAAVHAFAARSPAALVVAQADDLGGERMAVNLPGTDRERPNWRRRIQAPLPDLMKTPMAEAILTALRKERPQR
jgi:glycogen operon protein